jgi:hypothetical protein
VTDSGWTTILGAVLGAGALYAAAIHAAKANYRTTELQLTRQAKQQERQHEQLLEAQRLQHEAATKAQRDNEEWKRSLDASQEVFGAVSNLLDLLMQRSAMDEKQVRELDAVRLECRRLVNHHRLFLDHDFGSKWADAQGPLVRSVEGDTSAHTPAIGALTDCRAILALEKWSEQ